ncbi:MAG TPA: helix-turn-helix domain-containing protein [Rectinemataceae bacterium]|nr:helix-turn-helix domain-containing protein [Rectinemataceae bacterium]
MGELLPLEGLELDEVLATLEHYCRATATGAHLIGADGQVLAVFDQFGKRRTDEESPAGLCPICRVAGEADQNEELRVQLYSAFQAERFGGQYIQLCPHSLLIWTAPLVVDGIMRAAFVGGPALVVDPTEVFEELSAAGKIPADKEDAVRAALETVPRVTAVRAASLAALLARLARSSTAADFGKQSEREEQQARISEYIHDLKEENDRGSPPYPIEKERELLHAISNGDKGESQRLLNEILGHVFFSSGQEPAVVRARVLELIVLLSRAALEGGADIEQIFGLNFTYLSQVQKMRSIEDIAHWLSKIMVRFTELVFDLRDVKHADTLQKALRYINAHYTEEITLDDVAGAVFLSPTYFSKLFNAEMKCRFTAYLNRVRIDKSRILLKNTDIPLVDIAGMVGYEDQSYFTKVFKKTVGVSPGRFRESGGRTGANPEIHEKHDRAD